MDVHIPDGLARQLFDVLKGQLSPSGANTSVPHQVAGGESGFTLPFGKYKGQPMSLVPTSYFEYLLGWDKLKPEMRSLIEKHLATQPNVDDDSDNPF